MRILFTFCLILFFLQKTDYRTEFTFDYTRALNFLDANSHLFAGYAGRYSSDTAVIASVVFPEIIRYNLFKNYLETRALELIYVKYGKAYADFSVGYFQMKPSFVEWLENFIDSKPRLFAVFGFITEFEHRNEKKIRRERLKRLKSLNWQMIYLNCFYAAATERFHQLTFYDMEDKIRFYATAYNHGIDKSAEEIYRWSDVAVFPYGIKSTARQFRYSDISIEFYRKEYMHLFR